MGLRGRDSGGRCGVVARGPVGCVTTMAWTGTHLAVARGGCGGEGRLRLGCGVLSLWVSGAVVAPVAGGAHVVGLGVAGAW